MAIQHQGYEFKSYQLIILFIILGQQSSTVYKSPEKQKEDPELDSENTSMYSNDCLPITEEKINAFTFN